jgi:MFS family permease
MGFLALFLCFLPVGSGAASNLWSAVAGDWRASADTVALVTGVLGGILSAAGCLIGGWICDRMDRKLAYVLYGVLQAASAIGMALAPRTEPMFIFWTCLYAVITGLTFAGFTAFVLEAMGTGAAATKYNVFASLSNAPIYYMTVLDGWAYTRWGPRGMLNIEAALGLLGMVLFFAMLAAVNRFKPAPACA